MTLSCLETIIKKAMEYAEGSCTFAFQGGEPTLAGIDFFEAVVALEKKYNLRKIVVINALQTNGTLVDEQWAKFLSQNNFFVGISLDGTRKSHDANRIDLQGNGTYDKVKRAIALMEQYQIEYNILTVVHKVVAREAKKIYKFNKNKKIKFLQFIPCIEVENGKRAKEYMPSVQEFAMFLIEMFDCWYHDMQKRQAISIQYFDNLLGIMSGYAPEVCGMKGECSCNLVIEANGGVYPCDFYAMDEWLLGNIKEMMFQDFVYTKQGTAFIQSSQKVAAKCKVCKWFYFCRGGCRKFREFRKFEKNVDLGVNYYCLSYQKFFEHAVPKLQILCKKIMKR
jgi:uncharacterized protein